MGKQARRWSGKILLGVMIGLALGFAVGWWLWPVQYTNTAPNVLRQDYYNDYIVMTAAAYHVDGNLEQAHNRLQLLNPTNPAAPAIELAERLIAARGSAEDITHLAHLVEALGPCPTSLNPYLEDGSE